MNKEHIIEEMAREMLEIITSANVEPVLEIDGKEIVLGENATKILDNILEQAFIPYLAKHLTEQGYRKISEIEKWTIREISEGIENIIAEFERLKAVGFKHDDKWRFDNLVSDIRDFMKEYEEQKMRGE
jgi:hypothetical protein